MRNLSLLSLGSLFLFICDAGCSDSVSPKPDSGVDTSVTSIDLGFTTDSPSPDSAALKANGEVCDAGSECESGHCVDGVCCDTACAGTCEACNLTGSTGSCTTITAGEDPDDECAGLSCAGFFAGFTGNTCNARADADDQTVSCDGEGACTTAAVVCSDQAVGPAQITCDETCGTPDSATCTGSTPGACLDQDLGSITCGADTCEVTAPICEGGVERTCLTLIGEFMGPTAYLSQADSPFDPALFAWFYLEDMEDGAVNTPGLTASTGSFSSTFGASLIDSVDGDDGDAANGTCSTCNAYWTGGAVTYTFDPVALGGLPTHVGAVWTDGYGDITFEAYGECGLLGSVGPISETGVFPDSNTSGGTAEDRFFGVIAPAGITHIIIKNGSATETDHIQYGRMSN